MFKLSLDGTEEAIATLDDMAKQLAELHRQMPEELVKWQIEDLGRQHPNMTVSESDNRTTATTRIWRGPGAKPMRKRRKRKWKEQDWLRTRAGVPEGGEFRGKIGGPRRRRRSRKPTRWWAKEGEQTSDRTTDPAVRNSLTQRMNALLEGTKW